MKYIKDSFIYKCVERLWCIFTEKNTINSYHAI